VILATPTGPDETIRILPVTGPPKAPQPSASNLSPDLVVTTRVETPDAGDKRVMDIDDLYDLTFYGIDRSRLEPLFRETFGRPIQTVSKDRRPVRAAVSDLPARLGGGTGIRTLGVTLLVIALVLAGASVVALDDENPTPVAGTPPGSPSAVPDQTEASTPTPVPLQAGFSFVPTCPVPPNDANPEDIRPAVIPHVSPSGLEGWTITATVTMDSFPGPNALPTPIVPEIQHIATYRDPSGNTYRLVLSRWASVEDTSRAAASARADRFPWLVWGRYSAQVTVYDEDGQLRTDALATVNARLLFSQIQTEDGGKLGDECVTLLLNRTAAGGAETQPLDRGNTTTG
ncbi:MAG: hypothetical protein R3324_20210, partial [Halobacteriales archaeon]|nr:hypothetical protein [Halobacteriales archaeon]